MKKKKIEEKAINAIGDYLRSIGWSPVVVGFSAIEQGNLKYNFRLIVGFTGKKLGISKLKKFKKEKK